MRPLDRRVEVRDVEQVVAAELLAASRRTGRRSRAARRRRRAPSWRCWSAAAPSPRRITPAERSSSVYSNHFAISCLLFGLAHVRPPVLVAVDEEQVAHGIASWAWSPAAPFAAVRSYDERAASGIDTASTGVRTLRDALDRRPLRRRLHRPAHRPPAGGAPADHDQGRRLRARARRRRRLQAAELDDAADRDRGGPATRSSCARSRATTGSRSRSARCSPTSRTRWTSTPRGSRRTASRPTCRSRWPSAPERCGEGFRLVRREWPTDIGPVDLMCRDDEDGWIAVEIKRIGTIDAVEQLARYLERIRLDPAMAACRGVLAAHDRQAAGAGAGRGARDRLGRGRPRRAARRARARAHAVRMSVRTEPRDGVLVITIDRPEARNAIDRALGRGDRGGARRARRRGRARRRRDHRRGRLLLRRAWT